MDSGGPVILVFGVVFLAALIRAVFGFGDALVAMPLLTLLVGLDRAIPLVGMISGTLALALLVRGFNPALLLSAWRLALAGMLGVPFGLLLLKSLDQTALKILLAGLIVAFSLHGLCRGFNLSLISDRYSFLFGFVGGLLGGAYNIHGPPAVMFGVMRNWEPHAFQSTLQGYLLLTSGAILAGHYLAGLWSAPVMLLYLESLPSILLAMLAGGPISRRLGKNNFRRYLLLLLAAIGALLSIQTLGSS